MLEHDIFALIPTHFKPCHSSGLRLWLQNLQEAIHPVPAVTLFFSVVRHRFIKLELISLPRFLSLSARSSFFFSHPFKLLVSSFSTRFSSSVGPVPSLCSVLLSSALFVQVSVVSPRALLWYVAHWCDTLPTPVHISAALYCFNDCHLD